MSKSKKPRKANPVVAAMIAMYGAPSDCKGACAFRDRRERRPKDKRSRDRDMQCDSE
jgi:hypothetical protein